MKLDDIATPDLSTAQLLDEKFFSIGDLSVVFDILRKKLYSNPIAAVCREIPTNGRDALREAGKANQPIYIHLPNYQEPYFKVKDSGVGMSPDRMENIYVKYGSSTKRNDNSQTGGFGLGSRSCWAVSDNFSIITNYNGTQYNYSAYIDSTKIGKLSLLSSFPTSEDNGTEIIIPVESKDFSSFRDETHHATKHWSIKPIISGGTIDYQPIAFNLQGTHWATTKSNGSYYYTPKKYLIIDEIEYPFPDGFKSNNNKFDVLKDDLYLFFNTGDLSLSANREQVYLDQKTITKLQERIDQFCQELTNILTEKLQVCSDLWQAQLYYLNHISKNYNKAATLLVSMTWNNYKLYDSYHNIGCVIYCFEKSKYKDREKIRKRKHYHLQFVEKSLLVINDLGIDELSVSQVQKVFNAYPETTNIQIVCPNQTMTLEGLNQTYHIDQMLPKKLSDYVKVRQKGKARISSGSRLILFKFDGSNFKQTSYDALDEDLNVNKVLCLLGKTSAYNNNNGRFATVNNKAISNHLLRILDEQNYSLYGVDEKTDQTRIDKDLDDLVSLDNCLNDLLDNSQLDFLEVKSATTQEYDSQLSFLCGQEAALLPLIKNNSSVMGQYLTQRAWVQTMIKHAGLLDIHERINGYFKTEELEQYLQQHPDKDIKQVKEKVISTYPMFSYITRYFGTTTEDLANISQYINMVDDQ